MFHAGRQQPTGDIMADDVAQQPPEIVMSWVTQETAAVSEHPDKTTEQSRLRQGFDVLCHAIELVVKPPAAAELNFTGDRTILEIARHSGKHHICRRVDGVQDGARQLVGLVEAVQEFGQGAGKGLITHGIETGVRSQSLEHTGAVVPNGADMQLLRPIHFMV